VPGTRAPDLEMDRERERERETRGGQILSQQSQRWLAESPSPVASMVAGASSRTYVNKSIDVA
jgi:hypothetical protein